MSSPAEWPAVRARVLGLVAPLAAVAVFGTLAQRLGYGVIDDAYISLRYADQLVAGHGLVFNPGERVEGYSNFAWTLLLALGRGLGFDGPAFAAWLGGAAGAAAIAATAWLGARLGAPLCAPGRAAGKGALRAAGAPLALAVSAPFVCYAVSGLETPLYALLLLLNVSLLLEGLEHPRRLPWAGAALAAAALTRPETPALFLFEAGVLGWLWLRRGSLRVPSLVGFAAAYAVPLAAFLLWRHAYYGEWVPNTYHAKVGSFGPQLARAGAAYVARFGLYTFLPIALPAALWLAARRRDARLALLAGVVGVHLAAVALEGGDHLALFRFGAPILPLVALLWQQTLALGLPARLPGRAALVPLLTVATGIASSLWLAAAPGLHGTSEHRRAVLETQIADEWAAFGRWLAREAEPGASVALIPVGAIGYYSKLHTIDMAGLTDRHVARVPARTGVGYLGHEKWDNAYVLGREPTYVLAHHFVVFPHPISRSEYDGMTYFPAHRELVRLPALQAKWRFRTAAAGPGRVFAFYERRDAS